MQKSRVLLQENGHVPKMLAKSRFTRRQYEIGELFLLVFKFQNHPCGNLRTSNEQSLICSPRDVIDIDLKIGGGN